MGDLLNKWHETKWKNMNWTWKEKKLMEMLEHDRKCKNQWNLFILVAMKLCSKWSFHTKLGGSSLDRLIGWFYLVLGLVSVVINQMLEHICICSHYTGRSLPHIYIYIFFFMIYLICQKIMVIMILIRYIYSYSWSSKWHTIILYTSILYWHICLRSSK